MSRRTRSGPNATRCISRRAVLCSRWAPGLLFLGRCRRRARQISRVRREDPDTDWMARAGETRRRDRRVRNQGRRESTPARAACRSGADLQCGELHRAAKADARIDWPAYFAGAGIAPPKANGGCAIHGLSQADRRAFARRHLACFAPAPGVCSGGLQRGAIEQRSLYAAKVGFRTNVLNTPSLAGARPQGRSRAAGRGGHARRSRLDLRPAVRAAGGRCRGEAHGRSLAGGARCALRRRRAG